MSTLQVATSNSIATATLKNGTGGGAPARDEDAAHLMEAAQNADRNALWSTSATPTSPLNVDFTWGSSRTIEIVAALRGEFTREGIELPLEEAMVVLRQWGKGVHTTRWADMRAKTGDRWLVEEVPIKSALEPDRSKQNGRK